MAAERLPIDAFGEATWEMSAEEFGVFTRLLVHLTRRGGISAFDEERLSRVCGVDRTQWERLWRVVGSFFVIQAGMLTHPAISAAIAKDGRAAKKAQAMAEARWGSKLRGGGNGSGGANGSSGEQDPTPENSSITPSSAAASAQAFAQASETALVAASAGAFSGGFGGSSSDLDLISPLPDSEADPDLDLKQDTREPAAIRAVFDHYRAYHPRSFPSPKSGGKEWIKIRTRMREGGYSVADLCQAIDGYHRDPWHQGENDRGTAFLGLELIVRTDSHVAAGIEYATRPQRRALAPREQRAANTLAACLAEGPPETPQWMRGITSHS